MWSEAVYDTKKYEREGPTDDTPLTDRLKHNAFGGAFFRAPAQKITPSARRITQHSALAKASACKSQDLQRV